IFPPEYIVSPGESNREPPDITVTTGQNVSTRNTSFAMLEISFIGDTGTNWANNSGTLTWEPSSRGREWKDTANARAIIMSDRGISDTGTDTRVTDPTVVNFHSIWTERNSGRWTGSVLNNDGSTTFSNAADGFTTKYGNGPTFQNDHLFHDTASPRRNANARMTYSNATATLSVD
ncbi:MAG: hypothetical protein ACPGYV_11140, partial [Phycisphaeraceae bacterium]